ncbi:FtsX-like permease family protein [Parabacteroides sp. PF5-6]|uniref:ABC transporter permease n=1 Tax=Parabacteroides sp. PF5-6 TaxID=1742403 RepID=UPI002406CBAA|nr:FtsX-like permease family protein [Parabacteroides sp. PF5-6]MDF9829500.1 ABC-type antimicrobial peptide transport system permease subunit [Parabacteroides sp. PF5-6]
MFLHYLKIAFRNLRKYKTQNIISIIGLAIGFVCFAFSALWIRYEMSYDNFHQDADRIYVVQRVPFKWINGSNEIRYYNSSYLFAEWLEENYPEVEEGCAFRISKVIMSTTKDLPILHLDHAVNQFFNLNLPESFFLLPQEGRPMAVLPELEHEGTEEMVKQHTGWEVELMPILHHWPANTNIRFQAAIPIHHATPEQYLKNWNIPNCEVYIRLKEGADIRVLQDKLDKVTLPESSVPTSYLLTSLTGFRYMNQSKNKFASVTAGYVEADIKFTYIQIFAVAGLLVILCSLFNHLTLYVTRVRMRLRELALHKVNGASNWQIGETLYIDFLLTIVLSLVVGFLLMACLLPTFKAYADIGHTNVSIYSEMAIYAGLLIIAGFIAGSIPVLYFRKQALNDNIKGMGSPGSRNLFRKSSLWLQLAISLGMMFCAAVFIKQMHHLHHTDMGVNRQNVVRLFSQVRCCRLMPSHIDQFKQIPGIIDAIPTTEAFFRVLMIPTQNVSLPKDGEDVIFNYSQIDAEDQFFDFFGIHIIEGRGFHPGETANPNPSTYDPFRGRPVVFNETAVREFGEAAKYMNVVGVAKDFLIMPTLKMKPVIIVAPPDPGIFYSFYYKYEDGQREQTQQAITEWLHKEFPGNGEFEIGFHYMEDYFEDALKSERALLSLLSVMSIVCILIAIFGVYSLTSLTCEQRRREIAIRKVNGAEVVDIMNIFFKEYLQLLGMAALIAFPAGYLIMKRWLESYAKQTSMDAWLYVLIILIVFVVTVLSIVSMVWRTASQNPGDVVKNE